MSKVIEYVSPSTTIFREFEWTEIWMYKQSNTGTENEEEESEENKIVMATCSMLVF